MSTNVELVKKTKSSNDWITLIEKIVMAIIGFLAGNGIADAFTLPPLNIF